MRKGFTLIELLIVMGIVAVLGGFAVLSLFGTRRAQDLQFDAERIVAVLRTAQENSILQEEESEWGVCFRDRQDPEQDYYELMKGGQQATCSLGTPVARYTLNSSVEFTGVFGDLTVVFVRISGVRDPVRSGAFVTVQERGNPTRAKVIDISSNGVINIR